MLIGMHVSAAGGLENAPKNAAAAGCETFQFFSRSPQGGPAPKLDKEAVASFRSACEEGGFSRYAIHAPYYVNFASPEARIRRASIRVIREELDRGTLLGAEFLMTHLGSAKGTEDEKTARKAVSEALTEALDGYAGTTRFLIEIAAGSGMVIGDTFEEIAEIADSILVRPGTPPVGVCFDTQHAFASGYDLRTAEAVRATVEAMDRAIGLERVMMSHANDSKVGLGEHKDRHEHVGDGEIGLEGFRALLKHPKLRHWLFVLETPKDGRDLNDLETLKDLRG